MGHDTTAYLGRIPPEDMKSAASMDDLAEEIAYLRGNHGLYEALDAQFYDGKVSGIGIGRWFTRAQIQEGARRLWIVDRGLLNSRLKWQDGASGRWHGARYTTKPAIRFLQACLDRMPTDRDAVYIEFE